MKVYLAVWSTRFKLLLQYRAAAAAGVVTQGFWGLIRMMIFMAFYENAARDTPMDLGQVISYIWLGQAFIILTLMRGDGEIQRMIRSGDVACELCRPVDLYNLWYARTLATCTAPTVLRAVPLLLLATAAGWLRWPGPGVVAAWAVAIVGATLLSCAIVTLATVTMCWTLAGQGVARMVMLMGFLFSGMVIPLPLLPEPLRTVFVLMPFSGLCDTPMRVFVGHIPPARLGWVLLHQAVWLVLLVTAGRALLARARRKLVVQGG